MNSRTELKIEDVAAAHKAMGGLRESAASWRAGSFANVGRYVGLRWVDGKGLITTTPYVWWRSGWEVDSAI